MWSLFKLLFSRNYWRLLFRRETWRSTSVAIRRVHKDPRSWKQLARTLYLLLVPASIVVLLAGIAVSISTGSGFVIIFLFSLLMALLSRYGFGKRQKTFVPAANDDNVNRAMGIRTDRFVITPELRLEFARLALLHAVLIDRAGSESFIQNKILPEGFTVITRQRHLQVLREHGIYDLLGDVERDLMLLPDGHWPSATIDNVSLALEPLRLLRWILRMDDFLPVVGAGMKADYRIAGSLVREPELAFSSTNLISQQDLHTAYDAADKYFYRCWSEGVSRGIYTTDNQQEADRAKAYAERLKGLEGDDFLLGTTIVSAASDADVRLATTLGLRRWQVLGWVMRRMSGTEQAVSVYEGFYLR